MHLPNSRFLTLEDAIARRGKLHSEGRKVVLTNGCFDLLHTGHIFFLEEAAEIGDALFVAVNTDASVRALKGETRPIQHVEERAYALGALRFVDVVFPFSEERLTRSIKHLRPDIYVKAGDYTLETLDQEERGTLEEAGAEIMFLPFLPGFSTSGLLARIQEAFPKSTDS